MEDITKVKYDICDEKLDVNVKEENEATQVEEVSYLSAYETIENARRENKVNFNTVATFSGADVIVGIDEEVLHNIHSVEMHKRYNIPVEEFCKTIPDLLDCKLASVKNVDGVVIIDNIISDGELEIKEGATIQLGFANEYGYKLKKEAYDCHIIKRTIGVSVDVVTVVERIILVSSNIGDMKKFVDEVDGN